MEKNIPFVEIKKHKKHYQFYFEELPIHPDRLFPKLLQLNPSMIKVQVYKNEKLYWDAYYPITNPNQIEKKVWKAFRFKL